jgi:protocatechuate 3,4-dioxygenase beta subunit
VLPTDTTRRALLRALGATTALSLSPAPRAAPEPLSVTPADVEGPFYPVDPPADADNDLLRVVAPHAGTHAVAGQDVPMAPGRAVYLYGQVLDPGGGYIRGARMEIWQSDHAGVYRHPRAPGRPDPRFQGYGVTTTSWEGRYHFRTIRPVPYAGRTPHIHVRVSAPGFRGLTTQIYDAARVAMNDRDSLYLHHPPAQRELLTVPFEPLKPGPRGPMSARFDVVLVPA